MVLTIIFCYVIRITADGESNCHSQAYKFCSNDGISGIGFKIIIVFLFKILSGNH